MSGNLLATIIGAVLFLHGLGHAMGIIPALKLIDTEKSDQGWLKNWSSRSWLLTDLVGDSVARVICLILFAVALISFICAALALFGWLVPHQYWRTLTIISSLISIVALALYWNALILLFPHKIGYLAVDFAALICLVWIKWPSEAALGF